MDQIFAFVPRFSNQSTQARMWVGPRDHLYDVFLIQPSGKQEWQVGVKKLSARDELDSAVPEIHAINMAGSSDGVCAVSLST